MAPRLLKLELIYSCVSKKFMVRMLFFAMALAAVSVLYTVHDAAPCTYLSDCPDDFMIDFARPRWPLIRTISLQSVRDQAQPEIYGGRVRPSGGLGIESSAQIKIWANKTWREKVEFYSAIFRDLIAQGLLHPGLKALCVGASSGVSVEALRGNGLLDTTAVDERHSLAPMKAGNRRLPFSDNSLDFVFSGSFDRATVPALLASEIERTLKPNGVAVMLVSPRRPNMGKPSNLMHSLSPVVALFKCSDVIHVNTSRSPNSQKTTVIALRKRPSKPLGLIKDYPRSKENISLTKLANQDHPRSKQNRSLTKLVEHGHPRSKQNRSLTKLAEQDHPRSKQNRSLTKLAEQDHPRSKQNRSLTKLAEHGHPRSRQNRSLTKLAEQDHPRSKQNRSLTKLAEQDHPLSKQNISLTKLAEQDHPRSKQNRSLTKLAEPLTLNHSNAIFLPTVKDISDRKRHIYVEIGGNSNKTVNADAGWFLASNPKQNQTFDTYALNMSGFESLPRRSLNSIKQVVRDTGSSSRSRERFDIAGWLSEMSVSDGDFVVVKMGFENVAIEMKNMRGTGFTRLIDELFLQCSSELSEEVNGECLQFLQTLSDRGVFVHPW